MHETLREYGLEALTASQELEAARRAHAEHYLGPTVAHFESAELIAWLGLLEHEYANLHAALQWTLERPASELALRLETALLHFWGGRQRLDEGGAVQLPSLTSKRNVPEQSPAMARLTTGILALEQPQLSYEEQGEARSQEAATGQREQRAAPHLARSLYLLGIFAWLIGDFAMATSYAAEGLVRAKGADDKITLAYLIDLSGQIALDQGDDSGARALLEEGLTLHREAGDTLGSLGAHFFLERMHLAQGELAHARAEAEEHLALATSIGFRTGAAGALAFLGRIALEEDDTTAANKLFEESLTLLRETNENRPLAVATNLQGIGVTLVALGRLTEAVRLWGAAEALCTLLPEERAFVARARTAVRAELGEEAFSAAWAEGQAMTLEQAMTAMEHVALSSQPLARATKRARGARQWASTPSALGGLTLREGEVLRLVARGLTDAQIAEALVISPRTVNAHLRSMYMKLHISSRNAATYFALEHGLLE